MTTAPTERPRASVVIPAYNEGRVIGRCLAALQDSGVDPLEIIVAANGCTDDTVDVARRFDGVRVIEVAESSKIAALNAGDEAASAFPRIFLDADIVLEPGALTALVDALSTERPCVASPTVRFVDDRSSLPVRLFYSAYRRLPYVGIGMIGLGIYGLSAAGRARFDVFPDVQADDLFVQRLFSAGERLTTPGCFDVQTPRDLRNLLRVRTRVAAGNSQLPTAMEDEHDGDFSTTTRGTLAALTEIVRDRPTMTPAVITYVAVVAAARLLARRGARTWHRDDSTR